jgi:hypothetical protein
MPNFRGLKNMEHCAMKSFDDFVPALRARTCLRLSASRVLERIPADDPRRGESAEGVAAG